MLSKKQIDGIFTPDIETKESNESILSYFKNSLLEYIKQYNFTISDSFIKSIIDSTINTNQQTDIQVSTLKQIKLLCLLNLFYVNGLFNHKLNNVLFSLQMMCGPVGVCFYFDGKNVEQRVVECITRRCSTKYSIEAMQDLTQVHNIDIEKELLIMLSN